MEEELRNAEDGFSQVKVSMPEDVDSLQMILKDVVLRVFEHSK